VRRAKITFAAEFAKEQELASMTQVQIYETGKVSISGNCVQAKARWSEMSAASPNGYTSKPKCKHAIATTKAVASGEREDAAKAMPRKRRHTFTTTAADGVWLFVSGKQPIEIDAWSL
jgi:uncharacterized protein YegP (UPF0339 family)